MSNFDIGLDTTMAEILRVYPSAKTGLFIRYHIGGCSSCAYQPQDTLGFVRQSHNIVDSIETIVTSIRESAAVETALHASPREVAAALARGERLRLLDVRTLEEFDRGHLPSAELVTVELTFEALESWPKDAPIVCTSNHGRRSLQKASYFRAYGLTNARSLTGGLEAWSLEVDPSFPRPAPVAPPPESKVKKGVGVPWLGLGANI